MEVAIKRAKTLRMDNALLQEGENTLQVCQSKYTDLRYLLEILKDGDIKLLKGTWLADQGKDWRLQRQQDLPKEAFWTAQDLTGQQRCVLVVAVSYCWLHTVHPDPEGKHFNTLRHALRLRLQVEGPGSVEDIALFLDYCSLAQNGETETNDPANPQPGNARSAEATESYRRGMEQVDILYTNQLVEMWIMKWVPESEPRNYATRGWPFFEQMLAGLITDGSKVLSLELDIQTHSKWQMICGRSVERPAPLTPERFEEAIKSRSFKQGEGDADFVVKKYRETFNEVAGNATTLWFTKLNWTDKDAQELVQILPYCKSLEQLYLGSNSITTVGAVALAKAAKDCSRLQGLDLTCNEIPTGDGKFIFRHWVDAGKDLHLLRIDRSQDREGPKAMPNSGPVEGTSSRGLRDSIVSV